MESNTPAQPEGSGAAKPRRPFKLTGERLPVNKVQLVESLLRAGASITKTAKDIEILRNSVKGIANRRRARR